MTETLFELAREQREMATGLYSSYAYETRRFPSNQDPIRGEMARLTANFYGRVGMGECVELVYADIVEQARCAARRYNQRQSEMSAKQDWRVGTAGCYGEDEAELKIRHARTIATALLAAHEPPPKPLSPAESKVLRLIAHCLSREQICKCLGIGMGTLRKHEHRIFRKLGVTNRTQAALYAWRTGLVSIDDAWATVRRQQEGTHGA